MLGQNAEALPNEPLLLSYMAASSLQPPFVMTMIGILIVLFQSVGEENEQAANNSSPTCGKANILVDSL